MGRPGLMEAPVLRRGRASAVLWVLAVAAVALVARVAIGPGLLGYDALWGLRWGHEILTGSAPTFVAPAAPTPHPLVNLLSAPLTALGTDTATTVLLALSWLSFGALVVVVARFAAGLFGRPAGVVAGAALATRAFFVIETGQAFVDLPFLALAVWALDRERRHPRAGIGPPVALVAAGMLRPEGWALQGLLFAYRWPGLDARGRLRLATLLLTAPVLWAGMDLWATGDALYSLHGTQALGEALDRPRGIGTAFTLAPAALRDTLRSPLIWVALAGALSGLLFRDRASTVPGAIVVLGLVGYLLLGVAGLPLLDRYLLLPAVMLLVFAGLAAGGWASAEGGRWGWRAFGALAGVVVAIGIPGDARSLEAARDFTARRHEVQDRLRAAVRATEHEPCARAVAPDRRSLAVVTAQRLGRENAAGGTLVFRYASPEVEADYGLDAVGRPPLPRTTRRVRADRYWTVGAAGC